MVIVSQCHSYIYIILMLSSQEPLPFLEHMGSPSGFLWRSCFTFFSFVYIVFFTIACLLTVVGFFLPFFDLLITILVPSSLS